MNSHLSDLFGPVEHYAGLGTHRTGTAVDEATTHWLAGLLTNLGADVVQHPYAFPMFEGTAEGYGAAAGVPLDPLYYCAVGARNEASAFVSSISFDAAHSDEAIMCRVEQIRAEAKVAETSIAILATQSASDELCGINQAPTEPGDLPICLAPGHALAKLQNGRAGVRFAARISQAQSNTLTAFFSCGQSDGLPIVITTPVSGWFACAGERGTGIAIALSVATALSQQVPVLMVLPTGHELGYFGAARFLETFNRPVRGVLHLGSCVADRVALAHPGAMRAVSNLNDEAFSAVDRSFAPLGITVEKPCSPTCPEEWIGESELWAPRGLNMISMAGTSDLFHTPSDLPNSASSPELLDQVRTCVLAAAQALIN